MRNSQREFPARCGARGLGLPPASSALCAPPPQLSPPSLPAAAAQLSHATRATTTGDEMSSAPHSTHSFATTSRPSTRRWRKASPRHLCPASSNKNSNASWIAECCAGVRRYLFVKHARTRTSSRSVAKAEPSARRAWAGAWRRALRTSWTTCPCSSTVTPKSIAQGRFDSSSELDLRDLASAARHARGRRGHGGAVGLARGALARRPPKQRRRLGRKHRQLRRSRCTVGTSRCSRSLSTAPRLRAPSALARALLLRSRGRFDRGLTAISVCLGVLHFVEFHTRRRVGCIQPPVYNPASARLGGAFAQRSRSRGKDG